MTAPDGAAYWTTEVSDVEQANVYVRGYSLGDMIGRLPFSAATYLVIRGRIPTRGEARMVDAMLCSILDYALYKPGTVAARYTVSGNPNMQAGMAVAVMSVGEYTLAPDDSGRFSMSPTGWIAESAPTSRPGWRRYSRARRRRLLEKYPL